MRRYLVGVSFWKALRAVAHQKLLIAILLLACLLRLAGNLYDMPYRFHPDEHKYAGRAVVMMSEGTLNPTYFENPPLYTYAILAVLYALYGVKYAVGAVGRRAAFIAALWPTGAFGVARGLTALAGTTTCFLLFLIGKRFGGEQAGVLAALFYAVAFLSVRDGHFAVNDLPMVFLVTLAFYFAGRLLEGGRRRDLLWGGLTAGLAVATKYNGGIAFLPLLLACAVRQPAEEKGVGARRVGSIGLDWLVLLVSGLVGFVLGNPYAVLDNDAFLSGFTSQYELREQMWRGQSARPVGLLVIEALAIELGWPLLLLFPLSAAVCIARGGSRAKATLLALSIVLPLLLYHSAQTLFFARFLLPCTPFIALVCAWGIVAARDASRATWVRRPIIGWGALALLVLLPLARSLYLDVILQRSDTRIVAKWYLERIAPPGSAIVRETDSIYMVPLNFQRYRIFSLKADPSLVHLTGTPADYYLFSSFAKGRISGVSEADEEVLVQSLKREGFASVTISPSRDGGDLPFDLDEVYLPFRHLFRYTRPGPVIVIYARPGLPLSSTAIPPFAPIT